LRYPAGDGELEANGCETVRLGLRALAREADAHAADGLPRLREDMDQVDRHAGCRGGGQQLHRRETRASVAIDDRDPAVRRGDAKREAFAPREIDGHRRLGHATSQATSGCPPCGRRL
jgi:hypothetical protein